MRNGARAAAVLLLAMTVVAGVGCALGETLSVTPGDVVVITGTVGEQNVARVVLRVDVPEQVQSARIDFTELTFPAFLGDTSPAVVTVAAHCAQTSWDGGGVTWSAPWSRPGGDFDSVACARYASLPGRTHPVVLDITKAVRDWQHGRNNYGLFLKRPDAEGGGFLGERDRLRTALNSARVKFYFTPVQQ
ncbi:MAG TPA: DNRLRE domain-containing protein [bacterium]|nr:DNRLRE domain-containing protein [bacterium]